MQFLDQQRKGRLRTVMSVALLASLFIVGVFAETSESGRRVRHHGAHRAEHKPHYDFSSDPLVYPAPRVIEEPRFAEKMSIMDLIARSSGPKGKGGKGKGDMLMEGWLKIASQGIELKMKKSSSYGNKDGSSSGDFLPNEKGKKDEFYFRLNKFSIYFTETENGIEEVMGAIAVPHITGVNPGGPEDNCFMVHGEGEGDKWTLCAGSSSEMQDWICAVNKALGRPCDDGSSGASGGGSDMVQMNQQVIQPIIMVPAMGGSGAGDCSSNSWNYKSHGADWGCMCGEGQHQSPIDLPNMGQCKQMHEPVVLDWAASSKPVKARFDGRILRIPGEFGSMLGPPDAKAYDAYEVRFHTPAEHTLNGEQFDLEVQVFHKARGARAVVSLLFKKKAGAKNAFFEKVDPSNLPANSDEEAELPAIDLNDLFVSGSKENQFGSFFFYEGSDTTPGCAEGVKWFVRAEPLEVSTAVWGMLKGAAKKSLTFGDAEEDCSAPVNLNSKDVEGNNRAIQELGDRVVQCYKASPCASDAMERPKTGKELEKDLEKGHWEKRTRPETDYIYVNDQDPSGIPGAVAVADGEVPVEIRAQKKNGMGEPLNSSPAGAK